MNGSSALGNTSSAALDSGIAASGWMVIIGAPIIFLFGTVGNILSIVVLRQEKLWRMPTTPYLIALAIVDILVLWIGIPIWWLGWVTSINLRNAEGNCDFLWVNRYFRAFLFDLSAWIIAAVTVQRLVSVCFPLRARFWTSKKNIGIVLAILGIALAILNLSPLYRAIANPECRVNDASAIVAVCVDFPIGFCIPFLTILISNVIIIIKVRSSRTFREASAQSGSSFRRKRAERRLTVMLLLVSFVFLVCVSPRRIIKAYNVASRWNRSFKKVNMPIVPLLFYVNNGINFLLYMVSGPDFRKEFLRLFRGAQSRESSSSMQMNTQESNTRSSNSH